MRNWRKSKCIESLKSDWKSSTDPLFWIFKCLELYGVCSLVWLAFPLFIIFSFSFFFCQNDLQFLWSFSLSFSNYFRVTREEIRGRFCLIVFFLVCVRACLVPSTSLFFYFSFCFNWSVGDSMCAACVCFNGHVWGLVTSSGSNSIEFIFKSIWKMCERPKLLSVIIDEALFFIWCAKFLIFIRFD